MVGDIFPRSYRMWKQKGVLVEDLVMTVDSVPCPDGDTDDAFVVPPARWRAVDVKRSPGDPAPRPAPVLGWPLGTALAQTRRLSPRSPTPLSRARSAQFLSVSTERALRVLAG